MEGEEGGAEIVILQRAGDKKGHLIVLLAGKEAENPSNPFSSVQLSSNSSLFFSSEKNQKFHLFVQVGWNILLREAAQKVFGHRTRKALDFVLNCKDFHKTYQFIHCFTEAAMKVSF